MSYKIIVRARIIKLFNELNQGNYEPVLQGFAKNFEHWFIGNHALSGTRTTLDITRQWDERLFRIFPQIQFELRSVVVSGWPWETNVVVEWTDYFKLVNNEKGSNRGMHVLKLKWSQCVSVKIYCDTELLAENLEVQSKGGILEANAPPLIG